MRRYSLILLSSTLLGLFGLQCQQSSEPHDPESSHAVESIAPHVVVGKWETGDLAISFYDDGLASVNGVKARWRAIGDSSVRIELEKEVMEFAVSGSNAGELTGILSQGSVELPGIYRKNRAPNPGPQADG